MCVAEAHDRGVGGMVAGAPVPVGVIGVGAELYHAEGHRGSGIEVAVAACALEDVDRVGIGMGRGRVRGFGEGLGGYAESRGREAKRGGNANGGEATDQFATSNL